MPGTETFIIAGTGSRSLQIASGEIKQRVMGWLNHVLSKSWENHPDLVVMSGMSEGFDKAVALSAINLGIPLWCAIPSPDYGEYYWGRNSLTRQNMLCQFDEILSQASRIDYVMPDPRGSEKYNHKYGSANFDRNDFMVEYADAFVVYDPSSPGTAHCFRNIKVTGKPYKICQ